MTTKKRAKKVTYEYLLQANGVTLLAGQVAMGIPQGGNHVRQAMVTLPRFKRPPVINATICATDSPGNMFYFYQILYIDQAASAQIKFSAQSLQAGGDNFHYVCHYTVVGELK
ncbi:MAG TPA: hypothetical protein VLL54_09650 [Pyrinomonadaceae bacterium]|nr:hypothetical protein [Pyrinomonadaceae bacterium]